MCCAPTFGTSTEALQSCRLALCVRGHMLHPGRENTTSSRERFYARPRFKHSSSASVPCSVARWRHSYLHENFRAQGQHELNQVFLQTAAIVPFELDSPIFLKAVTTTMSHFVRVVQSTLCSKWCWNLFPDAPVEPDKMVALSRYEHARTHAYKRNPPSILHVVSSSTCLCLSARLAFLSLSLSPASTFFPSGSSSFLPSPHHVSPDLCPLLATAPGPLEGTRHTKVHHVWMKRIL